MAPRQAKNSKGIEMPKLKTHRGAAKRFKKTGTGKIVRASAFKRHILTSKTTKSKRHMRGTQEVSPNDAPKLNRMLPYKGSGF
jgi:large subunit ribosomal protein L35